MMQIISLITGGELPVIALFAVAAVGVVGIVGAAMVSVIDSFNHPFN
jgi:hypothetical protein